MRDYSNLITALRIHEDLFNQRDAVNVATLYRDAANAIEELLVKAGLWHRRYQLERKKVERLRSAVPHWISVEERLPEVEQSVLFCAFGRSVGEGTYRGNDGFHHVWKMYVVAGTYWDDEVTHWMPLPAAPKEVQKDELA